MTFDYNLDFDKIDFRKQPELYRVGKGEQGVLLVEPYKSEILPCWRFRTPEIARESSEKIYHLFLAYKRKKDFVGMDMARKFLQMGWTRARRYANHSSGRKYKKGTKEVRLQDKNSENSAKAESAAIFYAMYKKAREDPTYVRMKKIHQEQYG